MKKKTIYNIILISSSIIFLLLGILILITNNIINNFDWYLKSNFMWIASFMITFGIFLLGIFLLIKIKNIGLKIFLSIFWVLIIIVVVFIQLALLCWIIKTTFIREIDGVKYCGVEYVTNRLRKNVYYYKEYNIFAYHKTKEYIEEFYDYDDYVHPEFREYHKENLTDSIIYYYDKFGNIINIKTYNSNGQIIEMQQ